MKLPAPVDAAEDLGRGVFSSSSAKRARRSRVPFHVFLEASGATAISVDRLDHAPTREILRIATNIANGRGSSFHGWAVLKAEDAGSGGRRVTAAPLPDGQNPYHAEILLPDSVREHRAEQKQHAQELADRSRWRERPVHDSIAEETRH